MSPMKPSQTFTHLDNWPPPLPSCLDKLGTSASWLSSYTVIFPIGWHAPWGKVAWFIPFLTLARHLIGSQRTVVDLNSFPSPRWSVFNTLWHLVSCFQWSIRGASRVWEWLQNSIKQGVADSHLEFLYLQAGRWEPNLKPLEKIWAYEAILNNSHLRIGEGVGIDASGELRVTPCSLRFLPFRP